MILIENKKGINVILIQKPSNVESSNFTILLQNTITKDIYQYYVKNLSSIFSIYYQFEVEFENLIDGEYKLILINNPNHINIEVVENTLNIKETEVGTVYFICNKNDYLTNGELYITLTKNNDVEIITKELVKIGDYVNPNTQYNKDTKFITYNG